MSRCTCIDEIEEVEPGLLACQQCGRWCYVAGFRPTYAQAYDSLSHSDGRIYALWVQQNPGWQDATVSVDEEDQAA